MNRSRKYIAAILPLLVLLCFIPLKNAKAAGARNAKVSIDMQSEAKRNETFDVKIYMKLSNFTADNFQFNVNYDDNVFEYVSGELIYGKDNIGQGTMVIYEIIKIGNNNVQVMYTSTSDETLIVPDQDIHICTIKLKVKESAPLANTSVTVDFSDGGIAYSPDSNGELKSSEITTSPATINITNSFSSDAALKSLTPSTGALSPAFSSSVTAYTMTVPYTTTKVNFTATTNHTKASCTVSGDGNLKEGNNTVTVVVTAEDGKTSKTYTITVTRTPAATDNTLKSLKVNDTLVSGFTSSKGEYTVFLPYNTDKVSITAEKNNEFAAVTGTVTNEAIHAGESKTFTITVTSQSGAKKEYKVTVTRAKCSINTLGSIKPNTGTLSPAFSANVFNYTMQVPYTVKTVSFTATAAHATASIKYEGDGQTVDFGTTTKAVTKTVKIIVTAQDGTQETYTINVTRAAADTDNTLKSLVDSLNKIKFNKDESNYSFIVDYSVTEITITGTANSSFATVSGNVTNKELNEGENTFEIVVTSQSGEAKKYTVKVTRAACSINTLGSIKPSTGTLSPAFSANVFNYTMQVPYTVKTVSFTATAAHATASIKYEGDGQTVDFGTTTKAVTKTVKIIVTAQDGTQETYTINVTRAAADTDNTLKSLVDSLNKIKFNKDESNYSFIVDYSVTEITITGTANSSFATVSGNVTNKELNEGENTFEIVVTSQSGEAKTYTVIVTRQGASTDNDLSSLKPDKYEFNETFSPETTDYTMTVPYSIARLKFTFTMSNGYAVANVNSPYTVDLVAGKVNDIKITVTAQNGDKKTYTVHVTRIVPATDSTLKELTPMTGELEEAFDPSKTEYSMKVNLSVKEMHFKYAVNDKNANVIVDGNSILKDGINKFTFTVTAQDGTSTVYTVNVERVSMSSDATLKWIKVKNAILNFDPDVKDYIVAVPIGTLIANISFETSHELASAVLEGNIELNMGESNIFNIIVTAEDKTQLTYTVTVIFRALESDSSLKDLKDDHGKLVFEPGKTEYEMDVPYNTEKVELEYICSGSFAVAELTAPGSLALGQINTYTITVTAENGSKTVYTINVTRNMMGNSAKLDSLIPSQGMLTPDFDSEETEYTLFVPHSTSNVDFDYTLKDPRSSIDVIAPDVLSDGETVFMFKVTSKSGEYTIYTVKVIKNDISSDSALSSITANGEKLADFDPSVFEYTLIVPNSVKEMAIECVTSYIAASADLTMSPEEFAVGDNMYIITVTAEDGSTSQYSITVRRLDVDSDSTLSDIKIDGSSVEFDPSKTEYDIEVKHDVDSIRIEFTVSSEYAKAELRGPEKLELGKVNKYIIIVTADDGSVNEYKLNVLRRKLSSDSLAASIVIGDINIDVLASDKNYEITFPFGTDTVTIIATANDPRAVVEITGDETLKIGNNVIIVKITAEDGSSTIYTINAVRDAGSSDATLRDIIPSMGKLNEKFSPNLVEYTLNVDKTVDKIDLEVITANALASYVISDTSLKTGQNRITVTVTSENGTVLTYTVNVIKQGDSLWYKLCNTTVLSIGGFNVSVLAFAIIALAIITGCIVIIIIVQDKDKVKRIKRR